MSINLDSLSAKELDALINQAKKRKTTLSKRKPIAQVRSKLTQLARAEGYSIAELFGGASASKAAPATRAPARKARKGGSTAKVAPKYRNPANPSETWAGRGKQPRWLSAYTNAGRKLEDFLIR
ncbi:H-NS family nucleoid-associated regulatory protein [Lysobacter panacisoli]|uniref:H-NS family nucleoid-associated regulatory protein n=1 Tax=Lysobacter panacisoli TaxID=1255263 RepID=A0ABP9L7R9_9GAMM|nr:H-NS histone family protein [Lysobacter panacisoli]